MGKTVYMFPGQGAQYTGMGKEFYDNYNVCRAVFDLASNVTGLDIPALCFEENDKINITEYTQIAMLTVEAAIFMAMEQGQLKPDYAAGLSLGEYGALLASKALDPADAFRVIRKRGIYMQEEVPAGVGGMAAVMGLDAPQIEKAIEGIDQVQVANYNCPGQIVISGKKEAVEAGAAKCKEAGAKRTVMLNVSGPFHSDLLKGAGTKLEAVLNEIEIGTPKIPYVANVTAGYVTEQADIQPLLVRQVSSSVRWQQSVETMSADGVDTFIEIGPGRTLAGFNKKIGKAIGKELTTYSVGTIAEMDALLETLA